MPDVHLVIRAASLTLMAAVLVGGSDVVTSDEITGDYGKFILLGGAPAELWKAIESFLETEKRQDTIEILAIILLVLAIIACILLIVFVALFAGRCICAKCFQWLGDPKVVLENAFEEEIVMERGPTLADRVSDTNNPQGRSSEDAKAAEAGVENTDDTQRPSAADAKAAEAGEAPQGTAAAAADDKEAEAEGAAGEAADAKADEERGQAAGAASGNEEVRYRRKRGSSSIKVFWFSLFVIFMILAAIILLLGAVVMTLRDLRHEERPQSLSEVLGSMLPMSVEWTKALMNIILLPLSVQIRAITETAEHKIDGSVAIFDPFVNSLQNGLWQRLEKMKTAFGILDEGWANNSAVGRSCSGTSLQSYSWQVFYQSDDSVPCSANLYNLNDRDTAPVTDFAIQDARMSFKQVYDYTLDRVPQSTARDEFLEAVKKHILRDHEVANNNPNAPSPHNRIAAFRVMPVFEETFDYDFTGDTDFNRKIDDIRRIIENSDNFEAIQSIQADMKAHAAEIEQRLQNSQDKLANELDSYAAKSEEKFDDIESRFDKYDSNRMITTATVVVAAMVVGLMALAGTVMLTIGIHTDSASAAAAKFTTIGIALVWAAVFGALVFIFIFLLIFMAVLLPLATPQSICIELMKGSVTNSGKSQRGETVSTSGFLGGCSNPYGIQASIVHSQNAVLVYEREREMKIVTQYFDQILEELRVMDFSELDIHIQEMLDNWNQSLSGFEEALKGINRVDTSLNDFDVKGENWEEVMLDLKKKWVNIIGGFYSQISEGFDGTDGQTAEDEQASFMKAVGGNQWQTPYIKPTECGLDPFCENAGCTVSTTCANIDRLKELASGIAEDGVVLENNDPVFILKNILLSQLNANKNKLRDTWLGFLERWEQVWNSIKQNRKDFEIMQTRLQNVAEQFKLSSNDMVVNVMQQRFQDAIQNAVEIAANATEENDVFTSQNTTTFIANICEAVRSGLCDFFILELVNLHRDVGWMIVALAVVMMSGIQILDYIDTTVATEDTAEYPTEAPPAYQPDLEEIQEVPDVPEYGAGAEDEAPPEYPPPGDEEPPPPPEEEDEGAAEAAVEPPEEDKPPDEAPVENATEEPPEEDNPPEEAPVENATEEPPEEDKPPEEAPAENAATEEAPTLEPPAEEDQGESTVEDEEAVAAAPAPGEESVKSKKRKKSKSKKKKSKASSAEEEAAPDEGKIQLE